jgi:hypothetical protein
MSRAGCGVTITFCSVPLEQTRVVELGLVDAHVAVGVGRDREVPLPDVLSDASPGDAREVKKRDPAVAQVVW